MFALLAAKNKELESQRVAGLTKYAVNSDLAEELTVENEATPIELIPEQVESQSQQENEVEVESSQDKPPASKDEGWMEIDRSKTSLKSGSPAHELKFLSNKLIKVSLDQLVWAPLPRWDHTVYYPGRISTYSEAMLDPNLIEKNLNSDEFQVIEFFGQEELANTWLRNIIEEKKVYPYWAASKKDNNQADYEPEQFLIWNKKAFDKLRQGLEKKAKNKTVAKKMYDHIYSTAQDFLRLAREDASTLPAITEDDEDENAEPEYHPPPAASSSSTNKKTSSQPKRSLTDFALHRHADNEPAQKLRVGDKIRYIHRVFPDQKHYSHIVGFNMEDRQNPLILADDIVLGWHDFVAKISSAHVDDDAAQAADCSSSGSKAADAIMEVGLYSTFESEALTPTTPATGDRKRKRKFSGKNPSPPEVVKTAVANATVLVLANHSTITRKGKSAAVSSSSSVPRVGPQEEGRMDLLENFELINEDGQTVFKKTRKH